MKLWDKGTTLNEKIEQFTTEKDRMLDVYLAKWDILGSMAHIQMLESIGLLTADELSTLQKGLKDILLNEVEKGEFSIEQGIEDVHSQIELMLTRNCGEAGKKIHSGRSRNDQVLVDLKLFFRDEIEQIATLTNELFKSLQKKSEEYKDVLMPGYTHFQVAMPSSFGLWFGAYAENLIDDVYMLSAAHKVSNQNPLGSAAGYGSSFPLNRTMTTELLGFETMAYNVVNAQMGRGKTEKSLAYAIASIAGTLAKMSMDICLYNSQNFGFLKLPDEYTTGSSIMPHKKNPDVFELLRGKCNKLQALPFTLNQVLINLPSGYHRDLQVLKEELFPAIEELKTCLDIFEFAIRNIEVNKEVIQSKLYDLVFTVENVNEEVLNGVPFREAYKKVGLQVESGEYVPNRTVKHTHEGSIGNLCTEEIAGKMNNAMAEMSFQKAKEAINKLID